jgi:hypothetical protein
MYDIVPDIHGQAEKLKAALTNLGYQDRIGAWRHDDPDRSVIFLGDFIDRGPNNAEVLDLVRRMVDAGTARAVMGNHELNAIRYHTSHPETGDPLRAHSKKNTQQHATFLREFALGGSTTSNAIGWMKNLPLFLEFEGGRAVHACWDERHVATIQQHAGGAILDDDLHIAVTDKTHPMYEAVETVTKGLEYPLPDGYAFNDKDGTPRSYIRAKWWIEEPVTWQDVAMSVPEPSELPPGLPPAGIVERSYPDDAKPVFFGHYWLTGGATRQASNAMCLDYSAGKEGPLVSYLFVPGDREIQLDRLTVTNIDVST